MSANPKVKAKTPSNFCRPDVWEMWDKERPPLEDLYIRPLAAPEQALTIEDFDSPHEFEYYLDLRCQLDLLEASRKELPRFLRMKQVVILRFMYGKTLEEVGEMLGFTRERARQLESNALRFLKANCQKGSKVTAMLRELDQVTNGRVGHTPTQYVF